MRSYAKTILLKDDPALIAEYRRHHDEIWPEVVSSFKAVGVLDIRIWMAGRRLFMVMDAVDDFDPERDMAKYLELSPRCREWEEFMTTFQERAPEAKEGEHWASLDLVFALSAH
jgi:L-rhamnose mutarotase